jgi:hypothetical protein
MKQIDYSRMMTFPELYAEYIDDSTLYCCYCGCERVKYSCCYEVHYTTFAEMRPSEQQNIILNDDRLQIVP